MLTAVSAIVGLSYSTYLICKGYYWYCKGKSLNEKPQSKDSDLKQ